MLVAERLRSGLVKDYGKHPVSTDGGTWYPQVCEFITLMIIFIPPGRKNL